MAFSDTLNRAIEGASVSVVILADREQTLEIISGSVEAQRREQLRGTAVSVQERMDMHELKLGNSTYQEWINRLSSLLGMCLSKRKFQKMQRDLGFEIKG